MRITAVEIVGRHCNMYRAKELQAANARIEELERKYKGSQSAFRGIDFLLLLQAADQRIEELTKERDEARAEIKVSDRLLAIQEEVLRAIPECPKHGLCVPHAIEWVKAARQFEKERDEARADCAGLWKKLDSSGLNRHPGQALEGDGER